MLLQMIRAYVGSVKFTTFLVTVLTPLFAILFERTGIITPNEVIVWVAGIIASAASFILAQGWTDTGKEAAQISLQESQTKLATAYAELETAKTKAQVINNSHSMN